MKPEWQHLVPVPVARICATLRQHGYEAFVVGGAMRDALLGVPPHDWDIATSAPPNVVMGMFPKTIPTGIAHGTVTVVENGGSFEITTYRGEGPYSDGRRPDYVFAVQTIEQDLSRRDFTVNAIAGDPLTGEIRDPWGGLRDMQTRVLRAVGDPHQRFAEDGLRVMRAARFAAMLRYTVDPATEAAIPMHLATLARVSPERIFDELSKMLTRPVEPSIGLFLLARTGVMRLILPDLAAGIGMEQGPYHRYDVFEHTARAVDAAAPRLNVRLAALLHDSGKPRSRTWSPEKNHWIFYGHYDVSAEIADDWLQRMRTSTELRENVVTLVRHHEFQHTLGDSGSAIRRWIKRVGGSCVVWDLVDLRRADLQAQAMPHVPQMLVALDEMAARVTEILTSSPPVDVCTLAIKGEDIMRLLGVEPGRGGGGKLIGLVKKELVELVTEDPSLNTREALEPLVEEVARKVQR
jgi:tRNA nucleotidyltransferase (CCA-adding enzyme)